MIPECICVCVKKKPLWLRLISSYDAVRATIDGKSPPLSHKPDVLLQEVRVSVGNISLWLQCGGLWPSHSCRLFIQWKWEKLRKVPPATLVSRDSKWEPECLAGSLHYKLEFRGRVFAGQLREARRRWSHSLSRSLSQVIASQSWFGRRRLCYAGTLQRLSGLEAVLLPRPHRASSVLWGSPAVIEPQCAALCSNNANWIPSAGQVHSELSE